MTQQQNTKLNQILRGHSAVTVAQLGNLIESMLERQSDTKAVKASPAWDRLTPDQKAELSKMMDIWEYKANGGKGVDTPEAVRAFYKSSHTETTPIMPSKLIV